MKDVVEWSFDAIREQRFYIYSYPEALGNVENCMDAITHQRNPDDPYEAAPHIREMLQEKLRAISPGSNPSTPNGKLGHRLDLRTENLMNPPTLGSLMNDKDGARGYSSGPKALVKSSH